MFSAWKTNCIQVYVKYAKYEVSGEVRQLGLFRCFQCRSDQQPDCGDERFNPYRCMWWWKCVTIYFPSALSTRSVTISSLRAPLLASKQSNMVSDFCNNRHITSFNDVLPAAGHTIVIRGCAPFTSEVTSNHHFFISDLISICLAHKKWSNSHSQAFSPEMARSIGGNYWKVVKTQAFEQNLFLENLFPPRKATWSHSARTTSVTVEPNPTWPSPPSSSPLCWLLLEAICDKNAFVEQYIFCSYHLSCLQFRTTKQPAAHGYDIFWIWTQKCPKTSGHPSLPKDNARLNGPLFKKRLP